MVEAVKLDRAGDTFRDFVLAEVDDIAKFERLLFREIGRMLSAQYGMQAQSYEKKLADWRDRVKDQAGSYRSPITKGTPVVQFALSAATVIVGDKKAALMGALQKSFDAGNNFFQSLETGNRSEMNFWVQISEKNADMCVREMQRVQQQTQENKRDMQQAQQAQANAEREVAKQQ